MKRFYGRFLVGVWGFPPNFSNTLFPSQLKRRQDEFEWLAKDDEYIDIPNFLWPWVKGDDGLPKAPLQYDEET